MTDTAAHAEAHLGNRLTGLYGGLGSARPEATHVALIAELGLAVPAAARGAVQRRLRRELERNFPNTVGIAEFGPTRLVALVRCHPGLQVAAEALLAALDADPTVGRFEPRLWAAPPPAAVSGVRDFVARLRLAAPPTDALGPLVGGDAANGAVRLSPPPRPTRTRLGDALMALAAASTLVVVAVGTFAVLHQNEVGGPARVAASGRAPAPHAGAMPGGRMATAADAGVAFPTWSPGELPSPAELRSLGFEIVQRGHGSVELVPIRRRGNAGAESAGPETPAARGSEPLAAHGGERGDDQHAPKPPTSAEEVTLVVVGMEVEEAVASLSPDMAAAVIFLGTPSPDRVSQELRVVVALAGPTPDDLCVLLDVFPDALEVGDQPRCDEDSGDASNPASDAAGGQATPTTSTTVPEAPEAEAPTDTPAPPATPSAG